MAAAAERTTWQHHNLLTTHIHVYATQEPGQAGSYKQRDKSEKKMASLAERYMRVSASIVFELSVDTDTYFCDSSGVFLVQNQSRWCK